MISIFFFFFFFFSLSPGGFLLPVFCVVFFPPPVRLLLTWCAATYRQYTISEWIISIFSSVSRTRLLKRRQTDKIGKLDKKREREREMRYLMMTLDTARSPSRSSSICLSRLIGRHDPTTTLFFSLLPLHRKTKRVDATAAAKDVADEPLVSIFPFSSSTTTSPFSLLFFSLF